MVRNEKIYMQAVAFRKRGFTYSEISKICGVSVSTVSNWLSSQKFSKLVAKDNAVQAARENKKRMMLLNNARKAERTILYAETVRSAETEFTHYKTDSLFIAGLLAYMGVGDTTQRHLIRIASSRMDVHHIFIIFAKAYLGVKNEHIKFWLLLNEGHSEKRCIEQWAKCVQLPATQFYQTQVIASKTTKSTLQFGVGNTIIGSTVLKHKLNHWIKLVTETLK